MTEEIKHLVSERLEGFTPGDYKDGDSVIYRPKDSTEWATVTLGHVPAGSKLVERIGNTIRLYTGAPPSSYVESTFTPKKIEYNVGDTVNHAGVDYDVTNLKVNPVGGKIEYDLQISTPSPGFPAEVKGVTLEAINTLKTLDSLETSFQTEQTNIFDEVKKIQGEEKIKLFNELTRLSTMVAEMRSTLGSIETWSNLQAVDFERIEEKIKILNDTLKQAVKDLNAEIKIVLSTESTQQLSIDKKKAGEGILLKYKKELAKKDRAIKPLLREWDKYEKWKAKVDSLTRQKATEDRKRGRARNQRKIQDLIDKITTLNDPANKVDRPASPKPTKPSESQDEKDTLWNAMYASYLAAGTGLSKEHKGFIEAVNDARKKEYELAEGKPGDYVDPYEIYEANARLMKEIAEKWKTEAGGDELFDFNKEKSELEAKEKELRARAEILKTKNEDLANAVITDLDIVLKGSIVTGVASDIGIEQLDGSKASAKDNIIDILIDLGDLEAYIFQFENTEDNPEQAEPGLRKVDIPKTIMKEMMEQNPQQVRAIMLESFQLVLNEANSPDSLATAVENFINNIDVEVASGGGPSIREQLKQAGIDNWEVFVKANQDQLKDDFASMFGEVANTEVNSLLARKVADLTAEGPAGFLEYGKRLKELGAAWKTSGIRHMWGTAGIRGLLNVAVLGGVGIGTSLLLSALPGVVRGGIVGGAVGVVKTGLQRILGRDESWFQDKAQKAQGAAEAAKKEFIINELMSKMFDTSGNMQTSASDRLAHTFRSIVSEVTAKASTESTDHNLEIKDPNDDTVIIQLEGEKVNMYHSMMKRAAESEGLDMTEKRRFDFAKALHAVHNNHRHEIDETDPVTVRALKWVTDAYAGRSKATPRGRRADNRQAVLAGNDPMGAEQPGEKVGLGRQMAVTGVLGGGIGMAMASESFLGRAGLGYTFGHSAGEKSQHELQMSAAERIGEKKLEESLKDLDELLEKDVSAMYPIDLNLIKEYSRLLPAIKNGSRIEPPLQYINNPARDFYMTHTADLAKLIQYNDNLYRWVESSEREIARSGALEKEAGGFLQALSHIQETSNHLDKQAKNSKAVELRRALARKGRGVLYGVTGALISINIGRGVDAARQAWFTSAVAPSSTSPAPTETVGGGKPASGALPPETDLKPESEVIERRPYISYNIQKGQGLLHAASHFEKTPEVRSDILEGIKAKHPEWAKGSYSTNEEENMLHRWRYEMVKNHGGSFTDDGESFKTTLHTGAEVDLKFDKDGYPILELDREEGHFTDHDKEMFRANTPATDDKFDFPKEVPKPLVEIGEDKQDTLKPVTDAIVDRAKGVASIFSGADKVSSGLEFGQPTVQDVADIAGVKEAKAEMADTIDKYGRSGEDAKFPAHPDMDTGLQKISAVVNGQRLYAPEGYDWTIDAGKIAALHDARLSALDELARTTYRNSPAGLSLIEGYRQNILKDVANFTNSVQAGKSLEGIRLPDDISKYRLSQLQQFKYDVDDNLSIREKLAVKLGRSAPVVTPAPTEAVAPPVTPTSEAPPDSQTVDQSTTTPDQIKEALQGGKAVHLKSVGKDGVSMDLNYKVNTTVGGGVSLAYETNNMSGYVANKQLIPDASAEMKGSINPSIATNDAQDIYIRHRILEQFPDKGSSIYDKLSDQYDKLVDTYTKRNGDILVDTLKQAPSKTISGTAAFDKAA